MKRIIYSFFVATLLIGLVVIPAGASSMGFYITSVDPNSSVTIHTWGFPEGANMTVTMGPAGSAGLGYYVTTTFTGEGGVLDRTFADSLGAERAQHDCPPPGDCGWRICCLWSLRKSGGGIIANRQGERYLPPASQ